MYSEWMGSSMGWLTNSSVVVLEEAAAEFGKYRVCSYIWYFVN
jgi:hypothetical protein